jgi:hypothetical protein
MPETVSSARSIQGKLDMVMKETKLTERLAVEFGVQAFNVFNHVQLG